MRIFINLLAGFLMIMLTGGRSDSHGVVGAGPEEKDTNSPSDEENQQICQEYSHDTSDPRKFRRCYKHSGKHRRPHGALKGYGFLVPPAESQFLEKLVLQGRAAEEKGGEIYDPKRKKTTSIMSVIKKFLRKFRLRGSSTSPKPDETPLADEELITDSRMESPTEGDAEGTTVGELPVEVILPVSGVFLNSSTTKIPDFVGHEGGHTVYESPSDENQVKNSENSGTQGHNIHETSSEEHQGDNLEHSPQPPAPVLFGGRHATFDLEIKAIPILNRQRVVLNGMN